MNQWGDSNMPRNAACTPAGGTHFSLSSVCAQRERKTGNLQLRNPLGTTSPSPQAWGHNHWQQVPHAIMWKIISPHYLYFPYVHNPIHWWKWTPNPRIPSENIRLVPSKVSPSYRVMFLLFNWRIHENIWMMLLILKRWSTWFRLAHGFGDSFLNH